MRIPCQVARLLADVAEREAETIAVPMAVSIVDEEGGLLFFNRMDGALPVSTELAVSKAFTSAVLRMPTHELGRLAQPGGELYGIQETHRGRIVLFGGGLPLRLWGEPAGAVGVSGGTVAEDIRVAQPVVNALEEMERQAACIGDLPWPGRLEANSSARLLERTLREEFGKLNGLVSREGIDLLVGGFLLAAFKRRLS